jgi:hypothetical protein
MKKRKLYFFLFTLILFIGFPVQSKNKQITEVWKIEFKDFYRHVMIERVESHGIDKYQNVLLHIDEKYENENYFLKINRHGNEVFMVSQTDHSFSKDPIMDYEGNIFFDWNAAPYNYTYTKFDTNMSSFEEITVESNADKTVISNMGNIYAGIGNETVIDDLLYINTTFYSYNNSGYLDWTVSSQYRLSMNKTRSKPFLDWKFSEDMKGHLFAAFLNDLVLIDTINRTVLWHRKLSQEIHSITAYQEGVNVVYTDYIYGPILCSQISFNNEILNNFTLSTEAISSNYFGGYFNEKYYVLKLTDRRNYTISQFRIFTHNGELIFNQTIFDRLILDIYGLSDPTTEFYTFERNYDEINELTSYFLRLNSFERIAKTSFIIFNPLQIALITLTVMVYAIINRFRKVKKSR